MRSTLARSLLAVLLMLGAGAGVAGYMHAEEPAAGATVAQDPAKVEVWVTPTGKKYHTETCRYLAREREMVGSVSVD